MKFFNWLKSLFKKDKIILKPSEVSEAVVYLPLHYTIAVQELGVAEIQGKTHNSRILKYHLTTTLKASDDETPWCSSFANWCVIESGKKGTGSAMARSWLKWGEPVDMPKVGDVVVFWRENKNSSKGHVAFYSSSDDKYITVLGGNQTNKVCYAKYPRAQLLGYRRAV